MLFRPGLGYYCPDGEVRKTAVFLGLDFQREFESISLQQTVSLSREFASLGWEARVFRGCAGWGEGRGRQRRTGRGNFGPTAGNISVGSYSSTALPVM